jgi:hypothetical protein
MTQDQVIQMLKKVVVENQNFTTWTVSTPHLVALVNHAIEVERKACKKLAKEYAAEYKEGGRLYPMLSRSITKTAATACDHIVYIIGKRGEA